MIDRVRAEHDPIYARRVIQVAALIDTGDLDELLEPAQEMADIRAAEAARAEMRATGEAPIPWERAKLITTAPRRHTRTSRGRP